MVGAALLLVAGLIPPASAAPSRQVAVQVLNWTADDSITQYKSAPTQAVAGPTKIVFENSEATGNTTGMPHTLTFDTLTEGYNHDVNVNILANPFDANNGRHEQTVTLSPGRYRYFCTIPGHGQMVGEFVVTRGGGNDDTTPPTVSAQVSGDRDADGNYRGSATVTLTASDAGSGVKLVEYQIDDTSFTPYTAPVAVTAPGDHAVQYRATDNAGNVSEVGSVSFRVVEPAGDTTPPTVTAEVTGTRDDAGNYVGSATVTIAANDDQSGTVTVEYSTHGGSFQPYTKPVVVSAVGTHMVHYRATDAAGNRSAEKMLSFTVVAPPIKDVTAPVVAATVDGARDGNGNYLDVAAVTITATDAESGVARVEYALDDGAFATYTGPVEVRQVGAHSVRFRASDKAGNTSTTGSVSFTVAERPVPDTTPPETSATVSGTRDGSGNYLGAATVTITATDARSGVRSIEYAVGSGGWMPYSGPVRVVTPGTHIVSYRATDTAANVSANKTVTFAVVESGPDACPSSDERDTVIIDGDDTGVSNRDTGNGCTINDLIAERAPYPNHATFVRHVEAVTAQLVTAGLISHRHRGAIVRAAVRSGIGA